MHPIGQNILLIYPHFGIDFLQPPRFLNWKDSESGTPFRLPTGKCISSLQYSVGIHIATGYLLHFISTCRFKIYRKTDDLVRVVPNSRITHFHLTTSEKNNYILDYINTVEKSIREDMSYTACPSTVLRISNDFLIKKYIHISNIWISILP